MALDFGEDLHLAANSVGVHRLQKFDRAHVLVVAKRKEDVRVAALPDPLRHLVPRDVPEIWIPASIFPMGTAKIQIDVRVNTRYVWVVGIEATADRGVANVKWISGT
jgi:hypothetical protein